MWILGLKGLNRFLLIQYTPRIRTQWTPGRNTTTRTCLTKQDQAGSYLWVSVKLCKTS